VLPATFWPFRREFRNVIRIWRESGSNWTYVPIRLDLPLDAYRAFVTADRLAQRRRRGYAHPSCRSRRSRIRRPALPARTRVIMSGNISI
jgi:hypothetical protein